MGKEFKGTKGQWDFVQGMKEGNLQSHFFIISNKSQFNVCKIQSATMDLTEAKSNAKLISKAPEMLEALQFFVNNNMLSAIGEEVAERLINEILE